MAHNSRQAINGGTSMNEEQVIDNKEVLETNEQSDAEANDVQEQSQTEKTFTQAEVDEIVTKRLVREEKKREEAIKEAEKLAKMNAQQKKDYEFEKLQKELAELRAENNRNAMKSEASKMLREQNIDVDDDILKFVVAENADDTKANVESFTELFKSSLAKAVEEHFKTNGREINEPNIVPTVTKVKSIAEMAEAARIIK